MAEKKLVLWGATQVGKTTLLASGLLSGTNRLPGIDWEASIESVEGVVRERWRRLKRNMPILATERMEDVTLFFDNGGHLVIRDIQGGLTGQTDKLHVQELLKEADGILVVMEWMGANLEEQMNAVEIAATIFSNRLIGLAFTKCERELRANDPRWNAEPGWWNNERTYGEFSGVLERFGGAVWPTSAFGFDKNGRPACVLGEFGQLLPYGVRPRAVNEPFEWFFREMGLC